MRTLVFRKVFRLVALCAILSISLSSCSVGTVSIYSKGEKIKSVEGIETRAFFLDRNFNGINVSGAFDVVYIPGEDYSVELKTHAEVFDRIKFNIEGGILNVGFKPGTIRGIETLLLTIQAPELEIISMSGACDFTADEGMRAEAMTIEAGGASDIYIKEAAAGVMTLKTSGSSDVTIDNLQVGYFDVSVAGSSDLTVKNLSAAYLNMSVAGSSDIKLAGYANEADIRLKGSSDLNIKELESAGLTVESSGASTIRQ